MTDTKKPDIAKQPAAQTGSELSEKDLNQASGGALNAYKPGAEVEHGSGGGGGAGKPAMGDGSVRTTNALIGLL